MVLWRVILQITMVDPSSAQTPAALQVECGLGSRPQLTTRARGLISSRQTPGVFVSLPDIRHHHLALEKKDPESVFFAEETSTTEDPRL